MNTAPDQKNADPTSAKKRGARLRLKDSEKFTTNLPRGHRAVLDAYSDKHGVSVAHALRLAIELLEKIK